MAGALMVVAGVAAVPMLSATPAFADDRCAANHFCAYRDAGYHHVLLSSSAPRGTDNIQVAHDETSSGKNRTDNHWNGVDEHTFLPDETIFTWAPHTDVSYIGNGPNDKIDHFYVN